MQDLDDANQTVIYIPYAESEGHETASMPQPSYPLQHRDMPTGYQLRLQAYRLAWLKCLHRVKSIIRKLHSPVIDAIVEDIKTLHADVLPGLPYPEIPVLCITDMTGSSLLNDIATRLNADSCVFRDSDDLFSDMPPRDVFLNHLYPADCPNMALAMRALIQGFIENPPRGDGAPTKPKPTLSLATFDIHVLESWYEAVRQVDETNPSLVVILHDFEQFDSMIIQDIFYICSLHITRIPLAFILSLSSPPSPSYLNLSLPRSTLALLRIRNFIAPHGNRVLEEVLMETFFSAEFEPDIVIGPSTLDFLINYFTRYNSSLDSMLTILQLAHLKHFEDPLTAFVQQTPLEFLSLNPSPQAFLTSLHTRLRTSPDQLSDPASQSPLALARSVDEARRAFKTRARRWRVGVRLFRHVSRFMVEKGYRGVPWASGVDKYESWEGGLDLMSRALQARLSNDCKFLAMMVKKLPQAQFDELISELHLFFLDLPPESRVEEGNARSKIVGFINANPGDRNESVKDDSYLIGVKAMESAGLWLSEYLKELLTNLEGTALWDIWYTGLSPFPSELLNPSTRSSIFSALLYPHFYVDPEDNAPPASLDDLPDVSILFRRYLDSGKMINVYDWFESFAVVLENQRRSLNSDTALTSGSPVKGKSKGKDNPKVIGQDETDEMWKLQIQARFMHALQELDYSGFIKHTGRKRDHVLRTVFHIAD